jgi:dGTPase
MMLTRQEIEKLEVRILAPYAMKSQDSKGRLYPEPPHETRTCYQRDRDRIVHSEAFRKLEYKTQVFVIFEGDYYRTRLTHTIEVAQIARTIGRNLRLNEDLIEAIALAHDLGHPPFGHAGEEALDRIMRQAGWSGFNHNKRSFEIVTKFEKRYPDFDGLNLTKEVLVGILKHHTPFDVPEANQQLMKEGPTLEARVVDIADSLAYLNHDIDDGLTSGCITEADLVDSALWQKTLNKLKKQSFPLERNVLKYQIVKELIDQQAKDLLRPSDLNLKKKNYRFASEAQKDNAPVISFSPAMARERNQLQKLLNEKLYHHPRVERMTSKAKRIIQDLFDVYAKNPDQLPYSVYQRKKHYPRKVKTQIICHYIASMTDRFALDEHKKLFDPYQKV